MARLGRIALYAAGAVAVWLGVLALIDAGFERGLGSRVGARVAESLHAGATVERGDLALIRGGVSLEGLAIRRDDEAGHLAIQIASLACELPALGLALWDRDCRDLALRGLRVELSSLAVFRVPRPKRPPLHAHRVVIDDARLELAAGAVASELAPALGRTAISIEHAEAGDTVLKTPLSWLFAVRALRATAWLPTGATIHLAYDAGQLEISGGMFGDKPLRLAVALPSADPADDARAETARLIEFGRATAQRLMVMKAKAWLDAKLAP